MKRSLILSLSLPLAFILAACAPEHTTVSPLNTQSVTASINTTLHPSAWPKNEWWKAYNDPELNGLIAKALSDAPDMQIARQRITLAEAQAKAAMASDGPQIDFSADAERQKMSAEGLMGPFAITDPALKTQAAGQIGQFDNRLRNSVQYTTPTFSHFSASALYSAGENSSGPRAYNANLGVKYDDGSLYAGLAYTRTTAGVDDSAASTVGMLREVDDWRAAVIYRFSANTRLGLMYDRTSADLTRAGALAYGGGSLKQSVWYINGALGIGANGRLIAQYGQAGKLSGGSATLADMTYIQKYYRHL